MEVHSHMKSGIKVFKVDTKSNEVAGIQTLEDKVNAFVSENNLEITSISTMCNNGCIELIVAYKQM